MLTISPRLCKFLIETTKTADIEAAFSKIFRDYIDLKLKYLNETIKSFEKKWGMDFESFKKKTKSEYSYEVEKDFWEWEEAESLKKYYMEIKNSWM